MRWTHKGVDTLRSPILTSNCLQECKKLHLLQGFLPDGVGISQELLGRGAFLMKLGDYFCERLDQRLGEQFFQVLARLRRLQAEPAHLRPPQGREFTYLSFLYQDLLKGRQPILWPTLEARFDWFLDLRRTSGTFLRQQVQDQRSSIMILVSRPIARLPGLKSRKAINSALSDQFLQDRLEARLLFLVRQRYYLREFRSCQRLVPVFHSPTPRPDPHTLTH